MSDRVEDFRNVLFGTAASHCRRADSRKLRRDRTVGSEDITVDTLIPTQQSDLQADLESEKQRFTKAQRLNERIMKQLEEVTIKSAALEAQFRVRERNWKDKLDEAEAALASARAAESGGRQGIQSDMNSIYEKTKVRDKEHDNRVNERTERHREAVKRLKADIEKATVSHTQVKKSSQDAEKLAEMESQIRTEKALTGEAEADARRFQSEYENAEDALENAKARLDDLQEKVDETQKSIVELSGVEDKKKAVEKQLKQLASRVDELEEIEVNNKDNQEVLAELKQKVRAAKTAHDEANADKNALENKVSRAKSGVDANKSDRTTHTSRLEAIGRRDVSAVSRQQDRARETQRAGGSRVDQILNRKAARSEDRGEERKITQARQNIKTFERDSKREVEALDKSLGKAEAQVAKVAAALAKCEDAEKSIQKLISQEKELNEEKTKVMKAQQELVESVLEKASHELRVLQKSYKDLEFNTGELKASLDKVSNELNTKKKDLASLEAAIKQRERTNERLDRDLKNLIKTLQDTTYKLTETEATRADTQQAQQETHIEFTVVEKDLQLEIHCLEAEIYDQTEQFEALTKLNAELQKELNDLKWYFKPQREKGSVESRVYGTREFDEINKQASQRSTELEAIRTDVASTSLEQEWKSKTIEDLKKELDRTLQEMDPEMRGDILFELKDLTEQLKLQLFNQRRILAIVSLLAKHEVYPGAIRELSVLTKMNDDLHVMQRPEMLLKIVHREFVRDPEGKTFRRRLLERLVEMRMKRTNRTYAQAEDFIFYGEERQLEDIYEEYGEMEPDEEALAEIEAAM